MPNHHCCAPGCSADSRKDTTLDKYKFLKGVTFHAFPREPEIRDLWLKLMQRNDYAPNRYSRLCSLHFVDKTGPTANNPCPTIFAHNGFSGLVDEELMHQVSAVSSIAHQREALRTYPTRLVVPNPNISSPQNPGNVQRITTPSASNAVQRIISAAQLANKDQHGNARSVVKMPILQQHHPQTKVIKMGVQQGPTVAMVENQRMKEVAQARQEVSSIAERRRQQQEELRRVQAEIVAKAAANAQLLATINEAEKSGQIQLIDEDDIKAIQAATGGEDSSELNNPYRFINENTDLMWDEPATGKVQSSGQVIKKVEGEAGWQVLPANATFPAVTNTNTNSATQGKKRKLQDIDPDFDRDPEEEDIDDEEGGDDGSSSEEEEEEEEAAMTVTPKKKVPQLKESDILTAVANVEAMEEELAENTLRPPLMNEAPETALLRERLTLRGPHHEFLPKPRCKFCNLFFQSLDSLLGHLYRHTDRPYQCVECGATFRKAEELEVHIDVHRHREAETAHYYRVLGTKHGILECPVEGCNWQAGGWIRVFAAHIRMHNKGCCVLCGEGLHGCSEPFFMKHIKKHMSWTTRLKCPLCPQTREALPRKALEGHIKSDHASEVKPWACYHCDNHKIIPKFCELDLHLLKVHSSNPYECQYCGAAYPSLYGLRCHARKHHKRGKDHDGKYEWVEVVHKQNATKDTKLSSTRKSNTYQNISMLPQTGDRQMHERGQLGSVIPLFTSPLSAKEKAAQQKQTVNLRQQHAANTHSANAHNPISMAGNILTVPQVGKSPMQVMKIPASHLASHKMVTAAASSAATQAAAQQYMKKYKPQKVVVMQKDGTKIEKTLLLPVEDGHKVSQLPTGALNQVVNSLAQGAKRSGQPTVMKLPAGMLPPGMLSSGMLPPGILPPGIRLGTPGNPGAIMKMNQQGGQIRIGNIVQQGMQVQKGKSPVKIHQRQPSPAKSQPIPSSSLGIPQMSLADIASGNFPGGIDVVDESILESLGISSQDLELGPATENEENLGFTITEVRGDFDFGALPDDSMIKEAASEAAKATLSLVEDKADKTTKTVRCPYRACTEMYETAVGFWRHHYLKNHFKRSDLYEFMCRECGDLFANWDWPPEGHDCKKPRWACICADCGDVFETQRNKNAHYPDCIAFQKYGAGPTAAKSATVITATTCLYCHTTLKSVTDLCNHIRVSHVSRRFNSLAIYCALCDDYPTFPKPDALWNHYKTKHLTWWAKQPSWVCTKCGETNESEYDHTKHFVYTHAEEVTPQFLCGKCPYVFGQKQLFDMHKTIAHKD